MKLEEVFYCAFLTISVVLTCVRSEYQSTNQDVSSEKNTEKRIMKREAAILVIDNFPREIMTHKPKSHYKRISYRSPKPPKGKHARRNPRDPHKKYKLKKVKPVFSASVAGKKRKPTPYQRQLNRHQPWVQQSSHKPMVQFPHPQKQRKPQITKEIENEPTGFAEPPAEYRLPPQSHQEPQVDSYGAPLKLDESADPFLYYDTRDGNTAPEYMNWNDQPQQDSFAAYSAKSSLISNPNLFDTEPTAEEANKYIEYKSNNLHDYSGQKNKKGIYRTDMRRLINKPWVSKNPATGEGDKVLVGGQYAEPPARFVPILRETRDKNSVFKNNEKTMLADFPYQDGDHSATISPYVNYKNSNMAFSPQNLNDAFSIDR